MSYNRCVYHNCDNKSGDVAMFSFPVKDPDRLKLWIQNSGNEYLETLSNEALNKRYICAKHFPSSKIHINLIRSRLIGPAIPFHFERGEEEMPMDKETVNNDKISMMICRICLRSDNVIAESIDKRLSDFYNKITGVNVLAHPKLSFCSLCEYKLRKFYNFKQRCIRTNIILKKKITTPGPIESVILESLHNLIPQDLAFSLASDRRGFYDYKCQLLTQDQNAKCDQNSAENLLISDQNAVCDQNSAENLLISDQNAKCDQDSTGNELRNVFEYHEIKTEIVNDTDLIKTEVDSLLIDPLNENVNETECMDIKLEDERFHFTNEFLDKDAILDEASKIDAKLNKSIDEIDIDANLNSSIDEIDIDANLNSSIDDKSINESELNLDDNDSQNDSECESTDEILSKQRNRKKVSLKKDLSCKKMKKIDAVETEKFTIEQLESLRKESFDLGDFTSAELMCIKKLLSPKQKRALNFRMELENLKHYCINLLDQGKIDLGEVKITKELFLQMFAKCDTHYIKVLGIVNQMSDMQKLKKFILYLHKKYNPEYETIFKIDYLNTRKQKIEEFESRKNNKDFIEATYRCEECYLPFTHQLKLDYHKKWHDPNLKEVCDICPMRFPKRSHLKKHQIYHYSVYRCKLCPVFTYYFSAMLNHYNQHKGQLYTCDICLGQYSSKSTLSGHRLSHARLTCEICARKFNAQHYLDKHMKLKHANAPPTRIASPTAEPTTNPSWSCDKCDAVFKSLTFLRRHMRKHETLFYKCRAIKCYEKFSSASELREHALSSGHHFRRPEGAVRGTVKRNPAPYRTCPVCGMQVPNTSPVSLYNHHRRSHPTAPYHIDSGCTTLCEHCGKAFWHHSIYLDHLNTHTGEKPYACKDCDARYSTRRLLYSHRMKVHRRLHQCKDCGKTFYNRTSYIDHTKIHNGERPHECNDCGKKFTQKAHLRTHILFMHTANKPFACDLCDKKFRRKACLSVHMMVHTGQRPHPCDICDKQFYRKSELKAHVLKMHS